MAHVEKGGFTASYVSSPEGTDSKSSVLNILASIFGGV